MRGVRLVFLGTLLFCAPVAQAALLYMDPSDGEIYRGDTKTIAVRIDTDAEECINTIDAVLHYDPSIVAEDISRGNSILKLWVEDPVINTEAHTITFAGGIQNGYCGRIPGDPTLTNIVAEVIFRSPGLSIGGGTDKMADIWFDDATQVLLNDGFGTQTILRTEGTSLILMDTPGQSPNDEWKNIIRDDKNPPSSFAITLARDETAFGKDFFIAFNAQDKQSGIDHYEVMEEPIAELYTFKWGRADAPWIHAESPYVLKDQTLNSTIRVKAIDKAGNETITVYVPEQALRSMSQDRMLTISFVAIILITFFVGATLILLRRKKQIIETYESDQ